MATIIVLGQAKATGPEPYYNLPCGRLGPIYQMVNLLLLSQAPWQGAETEVKHWD